MDGNDKAAENKAPAHKDDESLFVRSSDSQTKAAELKDTKSSVNGPKENDSPSASSPKDNTDSLYTSVMKDVKNFGSKMVNAVESASGKSETAPKQKNKEEAGMLGSFELVKTPAEHSKKSEIESAKDTSEHSNSKNSDTSNMLNSVSKEAYTSHDAAFVTVANRLADDPKLARMVTDENGQINTESINHALKVDAGATVLAEKHHNPGPQELTASERESLVTVRTHFNNAVAGGAIAGVVEGAAHPGAEAGGKGAASISARALEKMSTAEIANTLSESKLDPKTSSMGDIAKALAEKAAKFATEAEGKEKARDSAGPAQTPGDKSGPAQGQEHIKPGDNPNATPVEKAQAPRENVEQIPSDQFATVAKQVLAKLDTNHTGEVTKEQLIKALQDPSFKGQEAQALAAMYHSFDSLQNLSGHEGLFSGKSITAGDLDKYTEIQKTQNQRALDAYDMKTWAHTNMSKFDKDNSGSLTKDEIATALKDPKTSDADKKMLETIQKHYSEMGSMWESGVNLKAFDDYASNIYKDNNNAKMVSEVFGSCYNVNQGQKTEISHDLYGDNKNPLASITPDAIKQGSIGDCYYESSLAAVAKAHPEMIKNAIKDNGDGSYTVTFPGDKGNPITVKAPTEAEQGLYNHGSPNGLWASVMEKAYGEYCQQHFWRRSPFNLGGGDTPTDGADGGGRTAGAMKLLTGHDVSTDTTTFTFQSTMATNLEKAFSSHPPKAVTAGINGALPFTGEQTDDKFYKGHAYSITNFVPDGKGGGMVTIRNPWGGQDGTTDGTITVPLDKFMKNFSDLSIEQ